MLHGLICGITENVLNTSLKTKLTKVNLSWVSLPLSRLLSGFVRIILWHRYKEDSVLWGLLPLVAAVVRSVDLVAARLAADLAIGPALTDTGVAAVGSP